MTQEEDSFDSHVSMRSVLKPGGTRRDRTAERHGGERPAHPGVHVREPQGGLERLARLHEPLREVLPEELGPGDDGFNSSYLRLDFDISVYIVIHPIYIRLFLLCRPASACHLALYPMSAGLAAWRVREVRAGDGRGAAERRPGAQVRFRELRAS